MAEVKTVYSTSPNYGAAKVVTSPGWTLEKTATSTATYEKKSFKTYVRTSEDSGSRHIYFDDVDTGGAASGAG